MDLLLRRRATMQPIEIGPFDRKIDYLRTALGASDTYIDLPINYQAGQFLGVEFTLIFFAYGRGNFFSVNASNQFKLGFYTGSIMAAQVALVTQNRSVANIGYNVKQTHTLSTWGADGVEWANPGPADIGTDLSFFRLFKDCSGGNAVNVGISHFAITIGDELVYDLIPVRIGTVGYMYDRVSGQLFGNSGSGAFVLGPDL